METDWKTLTLEGDGFEAGRQHVRQAGVNTCQQGMLRFYSELLERVLRQSNAPLGDRLVRGAVTSVVLPILVRQFLLRVPTEVRDRLRGVAQETGFSASKLEQALVLPDLLPWLQGQAAHFLPMHFLREHSLPRLGCSSFVARGDRFLIGRNLDFPGVGYWDLSPVIQLRKPRSGLRSISFTSAGITVGGISGLNEAQLYVALHQHYSADVSLKGTLPFILAEAILTEATNLTQATQILRRSRLGSGWAFVLADGKTRQACVWEGASSANGVRELRDQGVLTHTNYFQSGSCRNQEFSNSARMHWDNVHRNLRMSDLLKEAGEGLTVQQAARVLSDHYDTYWNEEKIVNRTVSQAFNIQSFVLDLEAMQIWLAEGRSPVHLGEYRQYSLGEVFEGKAGRTQDSVAGFRFRSPNKETAKRSLVRGVVEGMDGNEAEALVHLKASLKETFTPEVALIAGVLSMRLEKEKEADALFSRAALTIESQWRPLKAKPPEYYEIRLYQGRLADLQGKTKLANQHYQAVSGAKDLEDTCLKRLASRRRPWSRKALNRLLLPFSTYAPFT